MKKIFYVLSTLLALTACAKEKAGSPDDSINPGNEAEVVTSDSATVYFIKDISPENLVKIYKALGREATGKVAVKISTGESEKTGYLRPEFMAPLLAEFDGTIVECNTAYNGHRNTTENHRKAIAQRGFEKVAPVEILDAEGDTLLPLEGGRHLKGHLVGKGYTDYDFTVVLSHFKGHAMGGFGGALKNISIGLASSDGKAYIHSAGKTRDVSTIWSNIADQDDFLESMAEASKVIADHCGDKILYINVANKLSVDCDCDGNPHAPEMGDLGIFASLDPVALDQACVDAVYNSEDPGKAALIERMESRHGIHTLEAADSLGVGTRKYRIVTLK
ncbi:MAG: DUF362 domain-containing protein [Duncaniella sp.]|nr:DUF362 domain-containing protein [Duncaniella sp.]